MLDVGERAAAWITASYLEVDSAGGRSVRRSLEGDAIVIVRERAFAMSMSRGEIEPITTRMVVDLRRDFGAWVRATIAANDSATPGRPERESPVTDEPVVRAPSADPAEEDPRLGDYVLMEESPVALKQVSPEYPEEARRASIEGVGLLQALVGRNGRIKDVRVTGSIPALDEAAVAAVRQWEFKPARAKGKPVAVWVAIPVTFRLR